MKRNSKNSMNRNRSVENKRLPASRAVTRFKSVLRERLPELREKYKVRSLGVFGSYVRGQQRRRSDLGVLVELDDDTLSLLKFIELEHYLSDLVGVKVDLVEKSTLKPSIGKHILAEVVTL